MALLCVGLKAAGMGDHWPITDKEEKELAEANDLALSQLKGRKAKATIKQIEAIAPWLAYAFTVFVIFGPRVQQTMKERRALQDAMRRKETAAHGDDTRNDHAMPRVSGRDFDA